MKGFRKNDGFTLVELMVTFLVASIITLAASTILLLGIRIMNKSTDTVEQQHTTRVLLTALEDLAAEGTITEVRSEQGQNPENAAEEVTLSWKVLNGTQVIFSFDRAEQTIYTGAGEHKAPLLTGVKESSVVLDGKVLTFTVDTGDSDEPYATSIYCRMVPDGPRTDPTGTDIIDQLTDGEGGNDDTFISHAPGVSIGARAAFLKVLASQYGSMGVVKGSNYGEDTGKYYTELLNPEWGEGVAWCVAYISWALDQPGVPVEAPAEKAYVAVLERELSGTAQWRDNDQWESVISGDLIFFNLDEDTEADHVGVVLTVQGDKVYTIEGNSYNRVRVRDYDVESNEIIGYGVLKWDGETQSYE